MLAPTYLFWIIAEYYPGLLYPLSYDYRYYFVLMILTFTVVLPGISVLMLYITGTIKNLKFYNRQERTYPLILASVIYLGTSILLSQKLTLNASVIIILSSMTFAILVVTLITFYWKISAHSTGVTALSMVILGLISKFDIYELRYIFYLSLLISGLVMTSRLYLKVHTPMQIIGGFIVGLISSSFAIYLL